MLNMARQILSGCQLWPPEQSSAKFKPQLMFLHLLYDEYIARVLIRSKLNTECGRSLRFGRPSRSCDTGCWQNSLVIGDCGVLVGQVHTHPITMNWWMAGGTCHPINKPYEKKITAALLESSCCTASSPVYLNWSAPTCPATPVGKSGHQFWTKLSWNPVNESIIPLVNFLKILLSFSNIITNIKGVFKISGLLKTSDNIATVQFLQTIV